MTEDVKESLAQLGEEEYMETHDPMDEGLDEFDRYLMHALSQAPRSASEVESVLAGGLTREDRNALAALGTPEEAVDRVMALARGELPSVAVFGESTCMAASPLVRTVSDSDSADGPVDGDRHRLLIHELICRQKSRFAWNYKFVKKEQAIGSGGQGVVYLIECLDPFVGNRALKVLSPQPYPSAQEYFDDMQRMRSVAAVLHQIYHDNLVLVERFEPDNDVYVMIMRLIDGFDLCRLMQRDVLERLKQSVDGKRWLHLRDVVFAYRGAGQWGLAPGIAVNIIERCLRALQGLHGRKILHCDIKPSNIMLDRLGGVRLIDIGSAFQLDAPPKQHAWTPWYAPPEVLEGGKWTPQSDLASLGYVLIELLSGRPDMMWPVENTESVYTLDDKTRADLVKAKRQLPSRLNELLPEKAQESKILMKLCRRLIDPDPAARFDSAQEAILHTAGFNEELIVARLAMTWVWEVEQWILDVQKSSLTA